MQTVADVGYSKVQQLGKPKEKKQSSFGTKPAVWNKKRTKPKVKKSDVIDEKYLKWLAQEACVITNLKAQRGIGAYNIHIHHIYSRNKGRNDYKAVPLMGYVHSWGNASYHTTGKVDFIKCHKLVTEDIIEYFEYFADEFVNEYLDQGNMLKRKESD